MRNGFTLIELSIVLVIIGLIAGGVLAGQDLIRAAGARATISQIEKYNTAVNTFRGRYGALPGDLNASVAKAFGFTPRGTGPGEGDGNGIIEGVQWGLNGGGFGGAGETPMFWTDLTTANGLKVNLVDGEFSAASPTTLASGDITGAALNNWLPQAKIGRGNYIYVYSINSTNYFGLSAVNNIQDSDAGGVFSTPALTVQEAYSIDKKMDDGMPESGQVLAGYEDIQIGWIINGGPNGFFPTPDNSSLAGSAASCMDNGNHGGTPQSYSVEISNGANVTCALSFRFQ